MSNVDYKPEKQCDGCGHWNAIENPKCQACLLAFPLSKAQLESQLAAANERVKELEAETHRRSEDAMRVCKKCSQHPDKAGMCLCSYKGEKPEWTNRTLGTDADIESQLSAANERAAKQERDMEQLCDERDDAEECVSQLYYIVTGNSPEWSNNFGYKHAQDDVADAVHVLKESVKQLRERAEKLPHFIVTPADNENEQYYIIHPILSTTDRKIAEATRDKWQELSTKRGPLVVREITAEQAEELAKQQAEASKGGRA